MDTASAAPVVTFNLQNLMSWVLIVAFSTGIVALLAFLLMKGFWAQFIDPKLKELFKEWYEKQETRQKREKDIKDLVTSFMNSADYNKEHENDTKRILVSWYNQQATRDERETFTKKIIDDQIQRIDGVIRKEIVTHVDTYGKHVESKFQTLEDTMNDKFDKLTKLIESQREFQSQVLNRLGRIEGALSATGKFSTTDPNQKSIKP